jgi:L-arginine dehydrogenase
MSNILPTMITVIEDTDLHLPEPEVQAAVRAAFLELAGGQAVQPPQVVTEFPTGGDVIAYQAVLSEAGVYAVKVSPYIPQPDGAPIVTAWTLLLSTRTGQPLLLADASRLTAERTAATSAVAVDLLARPDATTLAVIGLGPIGRAHLRHVRHVRHFDDVRVYAQSMTQSAHEDLGDVTLSDSADEAADGADVVLLCTSAAAPVIDVTRLRAGTLVTSVSTNAPNAHEIDPGSLHDMDVYADYTPAAFAAAGEMKLADDFTIDHIRGDLPGLLSGTSPGPSGERVVFFRSVGLGIEDAAVARVALEAGDAS